jgi:hypothetical protein
VASEVVRAQCGHGHISVGGAGGGGWRMHGRGGAGTKHSAGSREETEVGYLQRAYDGQAQRRKLRAAPGGRTSHPPARGRRWSRRRRRRLRSGSSWRRGGRRWRGAKRGGAGGKWQRRASVRSSRCESGCARRWRRRRRHPHQGSRLLLHVYASMLCMLPSARPLPVGPRPMHMPPPLMDLRGVGASGDGSRAAAVRLPA